MHLRGLILFISILIATASWAWAKDVVLFANDRIAPDYNEAVKSIQPGDVLHFSHRSFAVGGILDAGQMTVVLSLQNEPAKVLRIPIDQSHLARNFMAMFADAYQTLAKEHISAVRLFESYDDEFAVVERLRRFLTFKDFVEMESSPVKSEAPAAPLPAAEMKEKFISFAESVAFFIHIGDMHDNNLVYDFDKNEWRLMDWSLDHRHGRVPLGGGKSYFISESPLKLLLLGYGVTSDLRFTATNSRYKWLEETVNEAHRAIELRRLGFVKCSRVHITDQR